MSCPYIDAEQPECQAHMRLDRLAEAIAICGHEYENCQIYRSLPIQPGPQPELAVQVG